MTVLLEALAFVTLAAVSAGALVTVLNWLDAEYQRQRAPLDAEYQRQRATILYPLLRTALAL